jgi:hypothetical protein
MQSLHLAKSHFSFAKIQKLGKENGFFANNFSKFSTQEPDLRISQNRLLSVVFSIRGRI